MFVLAMERSTYLTIEHRFPVAIAAESHPFPFRTRKLSPPAPMVLGGRPPGRVGRRRIIPREGAPKGASSHFKRRTAATVAYPLHSRAAAGDDDGKVTAHPPPASCSLRRRRSSLSITAPTQ